MLRVLSDCFGLGFFTSLGLGLGLGLGGQGLGLGLDNIRNTGRHEGSLAAKTAALEGQEIRV